MRSRLARAVGGVLVIAALCSSLVYFPLEPVGAFKPYTHTKTGMNAYADAVSDGMVTIDGRNYPLQPKLLSALRRWPAYYNAGVIGPDGFPDLIMGQSIIHPTNTGLWLRHLLEDAWAAQDDVFEPNLPQSWESPYNPQYNDAEEGQILAFTYGFLTHAAGDVWAHTLINEMSGEVFPGVSEMLSDQSSAEIALRHVMLEGYIGAATQGFDADPDETQLGSGDVAGDSTPGIAFAAPQRFIFASLVDKDASGAPTQERGAVLDFFFNLRNSLYEWEESTPSPLEDALSEWNDFQDTVTAAFRRAQCDGSDNDHDGAVDEACGFWDDAHPGDEGYSGDCNFGGGFGDFWGSATADVAHDIIWCPLTLGGSLIANTVQAAWDLVTGTVALLAKKVLNAYVGAWIDDIDDGLQHWGELGLAVTKGLFDPQTKRNAQNDICRNYGADVLTPGVAADAETNPRRVCENGVSTLDTVMWSAEGFINNHLLSMLGFPDFVGGLREILDDVAGFIDGVVGPAANPIRMVSTAIRNWAKDLVKAELSERFGIPIEQIEDFLKKPTTRIDTATLTTPRTTFNILGISNVTIPARTLTLLGHAKRNQLDDYLGLPHHADGAPLGATEKFNVNNFKAYRNAVVMSKMLLLDGAQMDHVLGDLVGSPYHLYDAGQYEDDPASNIMTTVFPGAPYAGPESNWEWLYMIDGDHAWRENGLPVFTNPDRLSGGLGNFPLFESCLLRKRVFRRLFQDWENDTTLRGGDNDGQLDANENFPDLGDEPTEDPATPAPPASWLSIGFPRVFDDTGVWVSAATRLSIGTAAPVIPNSGLSVGWKVSGDAFNKLGGGRTFQIPGYVDDGPIDIEYTVEDDCQGGEPLSSRIRVDTTAPEIFFNLDEESVPVYDTESTPDLSFSTYDAGVGADEAKSKFLVDGRLVNSNFTLNTNRLRAGIHTVQVVATDLLGNTATKTVTFKVVATLESLSTNLLSANLAGKIDPKVHEALQALVAQASTAHDRGRHAVEWKVLRSFIAELLRQRGVLVDFATAVRLESYATSILADETTQQLAPGFSGRVLSRP